MRPFFTLKILSHSSEPMRLDQFRVRLCPLQSAIGISMTQNLQCEKGSKEVIEYFNNNCSMDETLILTEMIKKLFILSIKHRKEFPVHLLSQCKKGQTLSKSRNRSETPFLQPMKFLFQN